MELKTSPAFFSVASEFGGAQADKLNKAIGAAAIRGDGLGNTAFFQDVIKGSQKTFEDAFAKGTKTPDISKLDASLKSLTSDAMDKQLKGVGEIADTANTIASRSKAPLNVEGMTTLVDELAIKAGAEIKGNTDAQDVFKVVNNVLRDSKGNPKAEIMLKDWASIDAQLSDLSSKFSENKAKQASIDGIIGRVKNDVLQPLETGVMGFS